MANLGKYTLVRKLAAGGMAEVFLARTEGPAGFSKTQVIKRILPDLSDNEEFVAMFLNEARLAALLNHPNIIQIFELGKEAGTYFIAMELVDGTNLRILTRAARSRGEFLPFEVVVKIISLACEGLAYAHELADEGGNPLGLVHRDVSPDNLLISRQGSVKVADFGIAKAANLPNITRAGILKGKTNYMAPEQLRAIPLDRRADVFSLGVVLHEALTATKPFTSSSDLAAMQSILNEAPLRIAEPRPDLPIELQTIIDKALTKDREQRYADCRALQADLDHFLVQRQVTVRAMDIANLVNAYTPPAPLLSMPALVAATEPKAGTPPGGTPAEEMSLEASLHDSIQEVDELPSGRVAKPITGTGPRPRPTLELVEPQTQPAAPLVPVPRPHPLATPLLELQGGRPPERSRPPKARWGWGTWIVLGIGVSGLTAIAVVVAVQHWAP